MSNMRRDFLFLISGSPEGRLLKGKHSFMATLPNKEVENLKEWAKQLPTLQTFLQQPRHSPLVYVGVRNDEQDELTGLAKAWRVLSGIIDGLCLLTEDGVPEVCELVQIREGDSADLLLKFYTEGGWARLHAANPDSQKKWEERMTKLTDHLLWFFEVVVSEDSRYRNDLGNQIQYSTKMFRHGAASKVFGIEYLSKFSAMEGLVCGSAKKNKEALLKDRLGLLFRRSCRDIKNELDLLWDLRCVASHQANAFYLEDIPESAILDPKIGLVEYLFTGSLVFALDKVRSVSTVEGLWAHVGAYDLPDYALLERPADMTRFPVQRALKNTNLILQGAAVVLDQLYAT